MSQRGGGGAGCLAVSSCCFVAVGFLCLSRSARGWCAMCDCGISWSYSLIF